MPRTARIVLPGMPHHVIQRGNRRQPIFFSDDDRRCYKELIALYCARHATRCLAWCLMDNHVHLILVPATEDGLRATLAGAHTVYSQRINLAQAQSGHLFQGRYLSYPMDESHLMVAVRYIENNPVKARLVQRAEDWQWSSARAHIGGSPDGLTEIAALGDHIANWRAMLADGLEAADRDREMLDRAFETGLPVGMPGWRERVAQAAGRSLIRGKSGPKGPRTPGQPRD